MILEKATILCKVKHCFLTDLSYIPRARLQISCLTVFVLADHDDGEDLSCIRCFTQALGSG